MKNRKGQVLPYMLIMSIVLILSWAMMINIAKILRDKMILQNNVDNTAISIANLQARTLNLLGETNYLMATVLSTAGYPESLAFDSLMNGLPKEIRNKVKDYLVYTPTFYVPSFSTDKICGSMMLGPFCDYRCNGINTKYSGVKYLRETVKGIQTFQNLLVANYVKDYGLLLKEFRNYPLTDSKRIFSLYYLSFIFCIKTLLNFFFPSIYGINCLSYTIL